MTTTPLSSNDEGLRDKIIEILGLEQNLAGQLIPNNMEDFQSDWTFTVQDIACLISGDRKAREAEIRADELRSLLMNGHDYGDSGSYEYFVLIRDRLAELQPQGDKDE